MLTSNNISNSNNVEFSMKELREILEELTTNPYPDYNLGLLPDEDGYDVHKIERVYNYNEMIDQAESQIKAWIEENVIGEDPPINTGDKQLDMVNANRILMLRDQRQQLREEK